tara:strand:- start:219 stop:827 length:609 start_codon:yes stop_codon:yes gene_type:complete
MKYFFYLFLFLGLQSCDLNMNDGGPPFYRLNQRNIPENYNEEGKIISFSNNQNEEIIRFKITKYWKYEQSSGELFNTDYKYERLWVDVELLDLTNDPNNFKLLDISQGYGGEPNRMEINVYLPHFYNNQFRKYTYRFFYPEEELNSMQINSNQYNKVVILNDASDYFAFFDNSTINKVYYDLEFGIVGFDDTINNIKYSLIN